jgi:hypothetical protein
MERKSALIGPYFIYKCHRKRDEMLGQVLAFLFHDGVEPAFAEMTIPFLKIASLNKTNIDRLPVRGARKRGDNPNKATKQILPAHDARDSANILRFFYAVHAPHDFGHAIEPGTQNVAQ